MTVAPLSILVVDDEPQIHRFLGPALEAAGYAPLRAETAREGLRLAAARNTLHGAKVVFAVVTTALTLVMTVAGIFGMNLLNSNESNYDAFLIVAVATSVVAAVFSFIVLYSLRRALSE